MRKFILPVMLASLLMVGACKKGSDTPGITSVAISASPATVELGQTVTFTVTTNTGSDVSAQATILVNNAAVTGRTFTASAVGVYSVKATYSGKESNIIQVNVTPVGGYATSITLTASQNTVITGSPVSFTVMGNTGANLTSQAKIYVNSSLITGTAYTPTVDGVYNIYATCLVNNITLTSPTIQVTATQNPTNFNKRVLAEDFTGAWCGWCPRMAYAIEQTQLQTADIVPVAIHRGNASGSSVDPFNYSGASALEAQIGLTGYPTGQLNRTTTWAYPEPNNIAQAVNLTTGTNPKLGLAMNSVTTGSNVSLNVKVRFGADFTNLRLVVYVLEDNLIYNQTNYTTYYGGGSVILNFIHNNVLRAVLTSSILGETVTGATTTGSEFVKNFNYVIPGTYQTSKLHFVAFVINSSNTAINARDAKINEVQNYEVE